MQENSRRKKKVSIIYFTVGMLVFSYVYGKKYIGMVSGLYVRFNL